MLTLDLPRRALVHATVHDVLGRQVRSLANGFRDSGVQGIAWDGRDGSGRPAAPGLYLVRVEVDGQRFARRAVFNEWDCAVSPAHAEKQYNRRPKNLGASPGRIRRRLHPLFLKSC